MSPGRPLSNWSPSSLNYSDEPGKSLFLSESRQVKSKPNAICCTEAVQCHIELNGTVLCTTADVITRE
jgi:hypothetical protein